MFGGTGAARRDAALPDGKARHGMSTDLYEVLRYVFFYRAVNLRGRPLVLWPPSIPPTFKCLSDLKEALIYSLYSNRIVFRVYD